MLVRKSYGGGWRWRNEIEERGVRGFWEAHWAFGLEGFGVGGVVRLELDGAGVEG